MGSSPAGRAEGGRRAQAIAALGTILEFYDFTLYLYLAPVIARVFFPSQEGLDGLLATFGVSAIAFLARPLGGILLGRYGDRAGRRKELLVSAAIITTALLGTALLPSEESIGAAAPVLLLCFRLAMGFSVGAEYRESSSIWSSPHPLAGAGSSPVGRRASRPSARSRPPESPRSSPPPSRKASSIAGAGALASSWARCLR